MESILKEANEKSFLYSKNNIVTEIDNHFINLTGYSNRELIGKSLTEISCILKIDSQISLENIKDECSCYIFTKDYEPIEITIYCKRLKYNNERSYVIEEKPDSDIKEKFDFIKQLYTDSKTGFSIVSVSDFIILKANENYISYCKESYNKISNCIGRKQKDIMPDYNNSIAEEILNYVITTGKSYHIEEFEYYSNKRGIMYWNASVVPIFVEGQLKYIINKILDVTEKVLNKKLLNDQFEIIKEQKQQFEAIIDNMSDQVLFINENSEYTNINSAFRNSNVYDLATLKSTKDIFKQAEHFDMNGDLISYDNMPTQRVIRGEKVSRYQIMVKNKKNTSYTEVTGSPIYDKAANFIGGVIICHDITENVKNQKNLLLNTQYTALKTMIENLDLGYILVSYPDLRIKYINNKAYKKLTRINSKIDLLSIIGEDIFDTFEYNTSEKAKIEIKIQNLMKNQTNSCYYYKKHIEEGKERFYKMMCQPILGLNNEVIEVIFMSIDITEEIKAKNKMKETLKMQDEMFSNISHELKTPLNVIFSTNQLMEFYLKNDSIENNIEKICSGINMIKQNCYRFTKLINNIIDTSKIESGFLKLKLSNENIVNIIENIVQSVSNYVNAKGLNIIFDTNTEEKVIACDPDKIERIILNLISNAIKFTNENGSIFVNVINKGDTIEISVKDTGIGMDKKHLNNIFKRFHQVDKSLSRNAEGSGIGLSLVKSIVELHGGQISVESKPYEGSIFKIEIPTKTIENPEVIEESKALSSKIEMINIEFSDIYSIS